MRIAFIGGFAFSPKGTMRARAHPLAAALVAHGHDVTIFLPPYDNVADGGRKWTQEGVTIRNMHPPISHGDSAASSLFRLSKYPVLLLEMMREVTRHRPDVIHVFKPKGFAGTAGAYFLLTGTPVVLDCDDWEGWGGWNEVKSYPWMVKEFIDRQERWMMRRAPAVTVASRTLADRARTLRSQGAEVYYVPNCGASRANLDSQLSVRSVPQTEVRSQLGLPSGPTVFYSGNQDDESSLSILCRAAAMLAPRLQFNLVFMGNIDSGEVRKRFDFGPECNLIFFPQVPYRTFLQAIWASDVAAFPYPDNLIHRAKCSARLLDYMSMGKAVITSAVGQNNEYIVNGESGVLVAPGDATQFADRLEWLLRDSQLRRRLGRNAETRIRTRFQWDGEPVHNCLAAYHRVLNSS